MKYCPRCKIHKNKALFSKDKSRSDGCRRICKLCDKNRLKKHYTDNKEAYRDSSARARKKRRFEINLLKESDPCHDCHEYHPYFCMEYDHLRAKKFNISSGLRRQSMKSIYDELKKCDLVCIICHRLRSFNRKSSRDLSGLNKVQLTNYLYVNKLKSENPCSDCNSYYHPHILDFDHIKGTKQFKISKGIYTVGHKTLIKEIAKCELVCSICHRYRTHVRQILDRP